MNGPYICPKCHAHLHTLYAYRKHIVKIHGERPALRSLCPQPLMV